MDPLLSLLYGLFFISGLGGGQKDRKPLGLPGGRRTALVWVGATIAAISICELSILLILDRLPDFKEFVWQVAYIPMSISAAIGQRLAIPKQLSKDSFFVGRTIWPAILSFGLFFVFLYLSLEHGTEAIGAGFVVSATIYAGLLFGIFLGWLQSRELTSDRKQQFRWAVATGAGAAVGTFMASSGLLWLTEELGLNNIVIGPSSAESNWLIASSFDATILLGVSLAQAVLIFLRPPVVEFIEPWPEIPAPPESP